MKKLLVLTILITVAFYAKSQDVIKTMYGDVIHAKVTEITKEEIKYTKAEDNTSYKIRIVKVEKIIFEDGTVKEFGGTLDFNEEEAEVLFNKKKKTEEIEEPETVEKIEKKSELNKTEFTRDFPSNVSSIAMKGSKIFLQARDKNTAIHARNYIEKWGFWEVSPDVKNADLIIKLDIRFQGPMYFFVKAHFVNPKDNVVLYTTQEFKPQRGNKDPNHKRAAVKHFVDKTLISNFR